MNTTPTTDRVPASGVQRRVKGLFAMGHRSPDLAKRLGCSPRMTFMKAGQASIARDTAEKVYALYDELRNVPGPLLHRPNWYRRPDWITPAEWDGYDIDNPLVNPRMVPPPRTETPQFPRRRPRPADYTADGRVPLCRTYTDPDLWHADPGTEPYREAMRACHACPVRATCARTALEHNEPYGVWGGLSEEHRRSIRSSLVKRTGSRFIAGTPELRDTITTLIGTERDNHDGS